MNSEAFFWVMFFYLVAALTAGNGALAQDTLMIEDADPRSSDRWASPSVLGFSMTTAMRLALQNHPSVKSRRSAIAVAVSEYEGSKWRRYPSASVSAGHALSGNDPGLTLTVTQPLWTAGRITSEIEGRLAQVDAASFALQETDQDLLQRVAISYSEALRLSARVKVAESNVLAHENLRGIIQRRVQLNVGARIDLSLADARLQQAKLDLMQMRSQHATVLMGLGELTGGTVGALTEPKLAPMSWADPQSLARVVLENSPVLRRMHSEVVLAQTQLRTAQSVQWPQVSMQVQRSSQAGLATGASTRAYVLMEYQPGAGLTAAYSMDAAAHRLNGAQLVIESLSSELRELSITRFHEAQMALDALEPSRNFVEANSEVVSSYMRQFQAGRKSWQEVMNAQREMAQSQLAMVDAQANVRLSSLKIQIITGEMTREMVDSVR